MPDQTPLWLIANHQVFALDKRPTPQCHAATLTETADGAILGAWFAGAEENAPDVGIWTAHWKGVAWTAPREVADGVQYVEIGAGRTVRHPCWNPALFTTPDGRVLLFFKVGPNPRDWWGEVMFSNDGGESWHGCRRLPEGILGPIKNKPVRVGKDILCPSSTEHGERGWNVHFEICNMQARDWRRTPNVLRNGIEAIQPTVLSHPGGRFQALVRTRRAGVIAETWSEDNGKTWSPLTPTNLPNPNSGIDAVTLEDGRFLLVYNPVRRGRTPISLAVSENGRQWRDVGVLADGPGEYSYPAIIQAKDGRVHILFTWKRIGIRHVIIDPAGI